MLFQYVNGDGEPQPVTSSDVNEYIKEATGGDFTAKHFRTWGASVIAFEQMLEKAEDARISDQDGGRARRRSARQHARDQPQILCPSGAARSGEGRSARPASTGWSGRAPASACRAREVGLLEFLAERRRPRPREDRGTTSKRQLNKPPLDCGGAAPPRPAADAASTRRPRLVRRQPRRPADRRARRRGRRRRDAARCGLIGERIVARRSREHCSWRSVIGRVLAKTSLVFMVVAAADVVATYAEPAGRAARASGRHRLHHRLRAPGRGLGARADPRRDRAGASQRPADRQRARQRDGDHPRARQRRPVRHRDHRHPRQSRGERHRAGRRARHRRHRHRPRRAGHLLRPVRGACRSCSTSRSSAATPSATTTAPVRSSASG